MLQDINFYLITGAFFLAAIGILATITLRGWRDWITLKHAELDRTNANGAAPVSANARIEVADLKERVKKLEAIAAGIDL
jgi:hypothetical protein